MTNRLIKPLIFTLFLLTVSCAEAQTTGVKKCDFNFRGFSTNIHDDAIDENGNHLLVGEICITDTDNLDWELALVYKQLDTAITKRFDLEHRNPGERMGIVIATDKNDKILHIKESFVGFRAVYNLKKKQFTIGCGYFDRIQVDGESISAWQPVIVQTNLKLEMDSYWIQKPYSCILREVIVENNDLLVFTRSDNDGPDRFKGEKAEVIRVRISEYHEDTLRPWIKVLDPISSVETPHKDIGNLTITEVSQVGESYYFATSNLDQSKLSAANHLYRFTNNTLAEENYFSDYVSQLNKQSKWVIINGCIVDSSGFLLLTHVAATKQKIVWSKTDRNFNLLSSKEIPLLDYADFDKMLVLSNGNTVILSRNIEKKWSYFLYDEKMQLIREIKSNISEKYHPERIRKNGNKRIVCIYSLRDDSVIQRVDF